ncbi:TPA: hypothetical protein SJ428_004314 [Yersinia enterocolitica]|nr:hypothetical protein [Yersinia enterocolitica]
MLGEFSGVAGWIGAEDLRDSWHNRQGCLHILISHDEALDFKNFGEDWRTSIKRSESKYLENCCIRCGFRLTGYDFVYMTGIVDG